MTNRSQITATPLTATHYSRPLLQPIVETARAVFGAAASSIFILDMATESLVFGAVAGAGEESLVGRRFPVDTGIAGWVLRSQQSLRLDDLADNPLFDRAAAESTVYVPRALMAAPLLFEDECVGVLEVLDWTEGSRGELTDLSLLGQLASQAAAAVRLLARSDWQADPYADPRAVQLCRQIVVALSGLGNAERESRLELLQAVAHMYGFDPSRMDTRSSTRHDLSMTLNADRSGK